ncbi:hypothetical protein [Amycolatopsis eburnea]|uniref:Aminotransferase class V-fold PLP-dependent enzyme n=1 Tax=Amycolatopsis eburnea TaxID=2267691 RepID=A0A3R9E0S4_9PSEU|nr:hypothetical protein [Amycolatopsis eburnea]RSD13619.1 hypothetical protein EIY87_28375 [Amycolatopsis eburnea]
MAPHRLDDAFTQLPERLRGLLAGLVGAEPEQIVLGNSTSHGLHLIANGLHLERGQSFRAWVATRRNGSPCSHRGG